VLLGFEAFRSQSCGRDIVNAVLIVGGVALEKAGAHRITLRGPPERVTRRHQLALQTIENRVRLSERIGQFMN
jgi:hypothetical protein